MADLVSVVIPIFNTNDRFKTCFESVLNQKYKDIEVILVDDGSSDASAEICDMIAQSTSEFPAFVIHKPNGGVSRARNLGIDFAGGKHLVFIDSDDIVTPDYISDFMDARKKYPEVGHIWCGFERPSRNIQQVVDDNERFSLLSRDEYFDLADKMMTQGPCFRVYDVFILKKNQIRMIEGLSFAEDLLFNLEYLNAVSSKDICVINAKNYIYIDDGARSLSNRYIENIEEINLLVLKTMEKYMNLWGLVDPESISHFYSIVYFRFVDIMKNTFHQENKMSYFQKIKHNSSILRSEMFLNALSLMNYTIPNHLKRVYQTKNYFWVRVYERIVLVYGKLK